MAQAAAQRAAAPKPAAAPRRAVRARPGERRAAGATQPPPVAGHAASLPRYLRDSTSGQPLPAGVQREMEGRFGAPLADVRVHTGAGAAASAAAAGARAYTAGSDIVFGDGPGGSRFAPGTDEGRALLAHELTHVVQQRRAGMGTATGAGGAVPQRSAADGGGRHDAAEREAEANARQVAGSAPLLARQQPAAAVQHADDAPWYDRVAGAVGDAVGDAVDAVEDVASAGAELVGDVADYAADLAARAARAVVRRVAPRLLPLLEPGGLMALLRKMASAALDGIAGALNALDPGGLLTALFGVFSGLMTRAAGIATALLSGDCQPVLDALGQLKTFVTEVAGAAWDRLTSFLAPVGKFFSDLWTGYLKPGLGWLQNAAGAAWAGILQFGRDIWAWTEPVRDAIGGAWDWVKEQLFGADDAGSGDSSGGLIGWITTKAGEAWDWVKEQTAPVWQPIDNLADRVREMLPPEFLADFGAGMGQLSTQLDTSATAMAGGDGVAAQRETLAVVLPGVGRLIAMARGAIVRAGTWVSGKVAAVGGAVSSMMGALRDSLFSALARALGWLEDAALRFVAWAQGCVAPLFDWLLAAFDALSPFIENAAGLVRRLIGVVGDLMQLPKLILSSVWDLIPCCIREPVKNFLVHQILGRIPVFGQFFTDPTLWPRVQATALSILHQVFVKGDLAGAAWSFFQAVLSLLGLPPRLVAQILAKAVQAIGDILFNPIGFLVNLLGAVRAGFGRFFDNIGQHLLNGISGWLFRQAQQAGITPPTDFSIAGIFGFVLQVLGVSVEHVFERLAAKLDAATVRRLRQIHRVASGVWGFLTILIEHGPAALWAEIQGQLANLWDTVLQGVVSWVTEAIVNKATRWLLSLLDVTGIMPVINALVAVWHAIESFLQYLREMLEIVSRMLDGVLDIARGAVDAAAGFLEDALGRAVPVAIGFLANQFGLGRLGERLHELLETVRGVVDRAIDWLIDRAITGGRALLDMARSGAAAVGGAVRGALAWLGLRVGFTAADGRPHTLFFVGDGAGAALNVESRRMTYASFLAAVEATAAPADLALARQLFDRIQALQATSPPAPDAGGAAAPAANDPNVRIPELTNELAIVTGRMMATLHGGMTQSTPPVYGGLRHGFGAQVTVQTLTNDAAGGSEPGSGVVGGLWDDLAARGPSASNPYYVRGHLLNHHLGGSGDSWANLTPLTQAANNRSGDSMLRVFEAPLKQHLRDGKVAQNVRVSTQGSLPARGADLQAIDAAIADASATPPRPAVRPLDELRTIRRIVNAEQHVPATLAMSATVIDPAAPAATPVPVSLPALRNEVDLDWTRYTLRR